MAHDDPKKGGRPVEDQEVVPESERKLAHTFEFQPLAAPQNRLPHPSRCSTSGRPAESRSVSRSPALEVIERVRRRHGFAVVGYVVMPEHVHLLLSEPERGNPCAVMKVLKQSFARSC